MEGKKLVLLLCSMDASMIKLLLWFLNLLGIERRVRLDLGSKKCIGKGELMRAIYPDECECQETHSAQSLVAAWLDGSACRPGSLYGGLVTHRYLPHFLSWLSYLDLSFCQTGSFHSSICPFSLCLTWGLGSFPSRDSFKMDVWIYQKDLCYSRNYV